MAIVTEDYYNNTFFGTTIAPTDFPQYEAWAERAIIQICHGSADSFSTLSTVIQTAVENAICAQMSYYALHGLDVAMTGITSSSFTVGKVSESRDSRTPIGAKSLICPAAYAYLEQSGLLNPQVGTFGSPYLPFWFGGGYNV